MDLHDHVDSATPERQHQLADEDQSPEHDDQYTRGELGRAAMAYIYGRRHFDGWPLWPRDWPPFEPGHELRTVNGVVCHGDPAGPDDTSEGRILDLMKAWALIAAEIDRLRRLGDVKQHDVIC